MARKPRIYDWPVDWKERKLLRTLVGKTLADYITTVGDGRIRLEDAMNDCLDNGGFRLRLDPTAPQYRRDADEKSLRRFVSEQLKLALNRLGTSILDPDASVRRRAYVWVPDHPDRQLSTGFYRLLGALDDDELDRFYERNQKLRVAYQAREIAAEVEKEQRVPAARKTKVTA